MSCTDEVREKEEAEVGRAGLKLLSRVLLLPSGLTGLDNLVLFESGLGPPGPEQGPGLPASLSEADAEEEAAEEPAGPASRMPGDEVAGRKAHRSYLWKLFEARCLPTVRCTLCPVCVCVLMCS